GGQKTRVLLGRLLLEAPDLLILDEPTNHLDVTAVEWLERTLRAWNGTLLIVSHDRYFLDRIASHIWELSATRLRRYKGNYTAYRRQRQLEWEREEVLFQAEKARLENELAFIRKNIAGGKSDIAKGKLKRLTREIVLIEQAGVTAMQNQSWLKVGERVRAFSVNEAEKRIRELPAPASRLPDMKVRLTADERGSERVVTSKRLQIGWPGRPLFEADDIHLERLDCAALIGPNGSGKSTLLRALAGEIPPLRGKLRLGDEVRPGYFAQAHEQLNPANRVIDEVLAHKAMSETAARNHLARYLFRGDDAFKRVSSLSGGERGRLALALLALDEANLLLLDEPTNHLDIPSQEILQTALERYDGAIVLVSHDRYLVDRLATQIWEIRDGRMRIFAGTYQEFLAAREGGDTAVVSKVGLPTEEKEAEPVDISWLEAFEPLPVSKKEKKKVGRRRHELIEQIEETEAWLAQLAYDIVRARRAKDDARWQELRREQAVAQVELDALSAELDEIIR
ncbi:MAG TPA: ABC-F family ATP-binding cassette domain-containing protein, partial [Anaerolineae bacterium]|nr:ABC-F family ATP-binding cassette domain-containing protein [Anaerolineae bacterium]